jgi:hypothetical protein
LGGYVEPGEHLEIVSLAIAAILLKLPQFGGIFLALTPQPAFLDLEIAQLLFVVEEGVHLDQAGLERGLTVCELIGELDTAVAKDGHLENGNASQTPGGIGKRAHELGFAWTDGLEFSEEIADVLLVVGGVFSGEKNGSAGKASFNGIQAGFAFAFGSRGAGRETGIGAVGGEWDAEMAGAESSVGADAVLDSRLGTGDSQIADLRASLLALRSAARRTWRGVML